MGQQVTWEPNSGTNGQSQVEGKQAGEHWVSLYYLDGQLICTASWTRFLQFGQKDPYHIAMRANKWKMQCG